MRTIKFRAWDKEEKKYVCFAPFPTTINAEDKTIELEHDRFTLEQSTGLFDKNGVEICEGDRVYSETYGEMIIKFVDGGYLMTDRNIGIYLHEECFDDNNNLIDLEVIGNVHEEERE